MAVSKFGLVAGLLLALSSAAAAGDSEPYAGLWACGTKDIAIQSSIYTEDGLARDIVEAQEGSDESYTLLFADDSFITLSDILEDAMVWFSDTTGETLNCTRLYPE